MFKRIFAVITAFAVLVCSVLALNCSAFAAETNVRDIGLDITYDTKYGEIDYDKIPYGTLMRLTFGTGVLECYQPHAVTTQGNSTQVIFEEGAFNHVLDSNKTWYVGSNKFSHTVETVFNKNLNKDISVVSFTITTSDGTVYNVYESNSYPEDIESIYIKYGFTYITISGEPYLWFYRKGKNDSSNLYGHSGYFGTTPDSAMSNLIPLKKFGSFKAEVDIPGGDSPQTSYYYSKFVCPECGSKNVSYRSSVIQTGIVGLVTWQVGFVFKCRDCGAAWRAMFSPNELDDINKFLEDNFDDGQFQEDLTLPAFTSASDWGINIPDDGNIGDLVGDLFSTLNSFTGTFNSFFASVFAFLPAPVLSVLLLGIALVIIIGIVKLIRG